MHRSNTNRNSIVHPYPVLVSLTIRNSLSPVISDPLIGQAVSRSQALSANHSLVPRAIRLHFIDKELGKGLDKEEREFEENDDDVLLSVSCAKMVQIPK